MLSPGSFTYVADLVRRESAIVLEPGKEYLVEARLLPLARVAGCDSVGEYVDRLRARRDPGQETLVVEALTTNETSWFRDNSPFHALAEHVLPEMIKARAGEGRLRIWSAACSSGQEPYSLAIVAQEAIGSRPLSAEILASDISDQMLTRTREGRYTQLEVNRGLPVSHLVKYFTRDGIHWVVNNELRRALTLRKINLAVPFPPVGQFDIVFLRNVLIYFDTATKRSILSQVRRVLRPDGYLFLGGAETTLGIDDTWTRAPVGKTVAYRPPGAPAAPGPVPAPTASVLLTPATKGA